MTWSLHLQEASIKLANLWPKTVLPQSAANKGCLFSTVSANLKRHQGDSALGAELHIRVASPLLSLGLT